MRKHHWKFSLIVLMVALLVSNSAQQAYAATTIVYPGNLNGWAFGLETGTTGATTFVTGPGTPPAGTGSLQFTLGSSTDGMLAYYAGYTNIRLDGITALSYSTYVDLASAGTVETMALQLGMDFDLTDADTSFQGRLSYEPYHTETVTKGIWQTWTPMTGEWFATRAPFNATCPQANPCTWAEVLTAYPNAGVANSAFGFIGFKAGSGWTAGFIGSLDDFTITTGTIDDNWDFELNLPPTETPSATPVTPSATPVTPTDTPTDTPVTPTNTPTDTPVTPTDTPTDTPVTPTDTPTDTPVTPTNTNTPVTPTNTPTCVAIADPPNLLSPVHRAHTTDHTPTFVWSDVIGALSYRLMVYTEDRSFVYKKRTFNLTYTLTAAEVLTAQKYLWRVRTQDEGCSTWSQWSTRNTLFVD